MTDLTRLGFVKSSVGAAVGMTAIGALTASGADAREGGPVGSAPVVAYVKDPRTGEISLMSGEHEVIVRDRDLAARLGRAAS